jgi:hypothetical protein
VINGYVAKLLAAEGALESALDDICGDEPSEYTQEQVEKAIALLKEAQAIAKGGAL